MVLFRQVLISKKRANFSVEERFLHLYEFNENYLREENRERAREEISEACYIVKGVTAIQVCYT